uniref:Uncharacterized protein n=1 Tax=Astopletus virus TaxID=2800905 RepID=A0A894KLH1_9VIRU|nr:MAG: hypothetical protein 3 [Astopletus virus]QRW42577.1 MAG: hypothetical protein 3 [Astopletus virus]
MECDASLKFVFDFFDLLRELHRTQTTNAVEGQKFRSMVDLVYDRLRADIRIENVTFDIIFAAAFMNITSLLLNEGVTFTFIDTNRRTWLEISVRNLKDAYRSLGVDNHCHRL